MRSRSIAYRPLFALALAHSYYRDGIARGLRLAPVGETPRLMQRFALRIDAEPGRFALWRGQEPERPLPPIPEDVAFAFALVSDDPGFVSVTLRDWPGGAGMPYVGNRHVAQEAEQELPSSGFEPLPTTRGSPVLPAGFRAGEAVELRRWWSGEALWRGETPAPGRTLAAPLAPAGRYTAAGSGERYDFVWLDVRPDALVGLLEIGLPRSADAAPVAARLSCEAVATVWDYVIASADPGLPLSQCRVVSRDRRVAFEAPVAQAGAWRFSSTSPLTLAEAPAPVSRLELVIPTYGMKTPDPVALPWPGAGQMMAPSGGGAARCVVRVTV